MMNVSGIQHSSYFIFEGDFMDLHIIRHAWAEERDEKKWPNDDLRPLTEKGKKRFREVAAVLVKRGVEPTLIATSPLVRCRQTAEILAGEVSGQVEVIELDELRPEGDMVALVEKTSTLAKKHSSIVWVGHDPCVSDYFSFLIASSDVSIRFAKGAVAAIRFDDDVMPSEGELQWFATAKLLSV
jgi:phosphohistidine phosphatase